MVAPPPVAAAIKLMSTLGLMGVVEELAPRYERLGGTKIAAVFAPTSTLMERIGNGETADVAILVSEAIERLTTEGILAHGSRVDLARSVVGIAVRAGAAKPGIGSAEAFKRTLLEAKSVAYSRAGASGIFFAGLIERLGVADEVNAKATVIPSGFTGEVVAKGAAELAVQQISELMVVPGIDIVGPLPSEIASVTTFSGAVFSASAQPEAGRSLLGFFSAAEAVPVIAGKGLEPVPTPSA
jgi:molybdate transport system substrate-binding protein